MNLMLRLMVYVLILVMEMFLIIVYSICYNYFIVWKCLFFIGFSVVYGIKLLNMYILFKICILSEGFFFFVIYFVLF